MADFFGHSLITAIHLGTFCEVAIMMLADFMYQQETQPGPKGMKGEACMYHQDVRMYLFVYL